LVSFPSWELFAEQEAAYQTAVLPPDLRRRVAVEAGVTQGWQRWVGLEGRIVGLDRFGASAPAAVIFEQLGFSAAHVEAVALELLKQQ
ncbi:MAG TPA: transketolase, partial [Anaerolineae bacterium]|nr:transketolase [Anaerolineae bacterium]